MQSARRASRKGTLYKSAHRSIISNTQFRDARVFSGFTRDEAAEFLGVTLRTIGHWETGYSRPPYSAFKLLRTYRHGDLIHPAWSACSINRRGCLVTPEGHEIKPSDLAWISLLFRRAEMMGPLLRERDQLQRRLQDIQKASAGEAGRGLGLVYYITSDTGTSENQLYQGFCLP
ncbi:VC1465 family Xer recombination activation factor, partial [Xanthomonas campestris pv. campestris]|nr:VC1465 family Xer recombination activation factor [Xanthomonas campestris pv. campestris]